MIHPDKLTAFDVYADGEMLLGVVDATLPNITPLKETIKGAGINGELETSAIGQIGGMKLQMTWRSATEQASLLANPQGMALELRGSAQVIDSAAYRFRQIPIRIAVRACSSDMQLGKFDPATAMGTTTEVECMYFKYTYNGKVLHEIDKTNFKTILGGTDALAEVNKALGR
jgi:P2 family phage contractile tail tube protein